MEGRDAHLPPRVRCPLIGSVRWRKAAILGVGLLGGSLGMALRRRQLAGEVWGCVRRAATIQEALEAGAIDAGTESMEEAVRDADLVVLCAPVAQLGGMAHSMAPHLATGAWVTDVGSVKGSVIAAVEGQVAEAGGFFVGSHPMAGSEKTGVKAGRADLFNGAVTVVTPTPSSQSEAVEGVSRLWESVGSRVLRLSPEQHDEWVSRTSHLPHLMAATLAEYVLDPAGPPEQAWLCATGFRDTTRVASGSPEMWRDIAMGNREALLKSMDGFERSLRGLRELLERRDGPGIEAFLRSAKERRDGWSARGGKGPSE